MARITFVKSARPSTKDRRCVRCGKLIEPGQSYKHASYKTGPYSSVTKNWCHLHHPRPSETTTNDRLSTLYGLQEGIEDDAARFLAGDLDYDMLATTLDQAADEADSVRDSYQESADNMPDNLQGSQQHDDLEEKASNVEEWAEALRTAAQEVRDAEPDPEDDPEDEDRDSAAEHATSAAGELSL